MKLIKKKLTTTIFVGTISTIFLAVAEQSTFDAVSVTASQETVLADWLIGI